MIYFAFAKSVTSLILPQFASKSLDGAEDWGRQGREFGRATGVAEGVPIWHHV
jgi:hypothetical protein